MQLYLSPPYELYFSNILRVPCFRYTLPSFYEPRVSVIPPPPQISLVSCFSYTSLLPIQFYESHVSVISCLLPLQFYESHVSVKPSLLLTILVFRLDPPFLPSSLPPQFDESHVSVKPFTITTLNLTTRMFHLYPSSLPRPVSRVSHCMNTPQYSCCYRSLTECKALTFCCLIVSSPSSEGVQAVDGLRQQVHGLHEQGNDFRRECTGVGVCKGRSGRGKRGVSCCCSGSGGGGGGRECSFFCFLGEGVFLTVAA